jgi:hypothetical protein
MDELRGRIQTHDMSKLTATSEQILQHEKGPILSVAFTGDYPPGSDGNPFAAEMVACARWSRDEHRGSASW